MMSNRSVRSRFRQLDPRFCFSLIQCACVEETPENRNIRYRLAMCRRMELLDLARAAFVLRCNCIASVCRFVVFELRCCEVFTMYSETCGIRSQPSDARTGNMYDLAILGTLNCFHRSLVTLENSLIEHHFEPFMTNGFTFHLRPPHLAKLTC